MPRNVRWSDASKYRELLVKPSSRDMLSDIDLSLQSTIFVGARSLSHDALMDGGWAERIIGGESGILSRLRRQKPKGCLLSPETIGWAYSGKRCS